MSLELECKEIWARTIELDFIHIEVHLTTHIQL